jgi:hypothetical protein
VNASVDRGRWLFKGLPVTPAASFFGFVESPMRALILIAGALALAACGNNDQSDNTQNIDENLTAENIVSNDVTAIDAVTGDAANMAAETPLNDTANLSNEAGNASAFPKAKPETDTPQGTTSTSKPAPSPVETTPSNAVSNGQ